MGKAPSLVQAGALGRASTAVNAPRQINWRSLTEPGDLLPPCGVGDHGGWEAGLHLQTGQTKTQSVEVRGYQDDPARDELPAR